MENSELEYYQNPRDDIRSLISGRFERCLDIGCGAGIVGSTLVRDGVAASSDGIELNQAAATAAKKVLSQVYTTDLSHSTDGIPLGVYDLVLCLDVLEHMVDPWAALRRVRSLMKPGDTLVISLPNVRNFRVTIPLFLKGEWRYESSGLLDVTHLRFFTRKTAISLVAETGFSISQIHSTSRKPLSKSWWADLLTFGLFRELLDFQYVIQARA